jgi:hypothetical protein
MRDGGQLDLFSISVVDPPWRDNRDAMAYPFLALQKRRTVPIRYSDANVSLSVTRRRNSESPPSGTGMF